MEKLVQIRSLVENSVPMLNPGLTLLVYLKLIIVIKKLLRGYKGNFVKVIPSLLETIISLYQAYALFVCISYFSIFYDVDGKLRIFTP